MTIKKEIKGLEWSRTFHIVSTKKLSQNMDWACNVTDFPQIIDKSFFFSKLSKL